MELDGLRRRPRPGGVGEREGEREEETERDRGRPRRGGVRERESERDEDSERDRRRPLRTGERDREGERDDRDREEYEETLLESDSLFGAGRAGFGILWSHFRMPSVTTPMPIAVKKLMANRAFA